MSKTTIIAGDLSWAQRERLFSCIVCGARFSATHEDYQLADNSEFDLGSVAAMSECPTCGAWAYSAVGPAGEVPEIKALLVRTLPKTSYKPGDSIDLTRLALAARWSNGAVSEVEASECTFDPSTSDTLALTDTEITVTHTASGKTASIRIHVENAQIRRPRLVNGALVYTGSAQSVEVSGFDSATMTRSNFSKTAAGSYTASYTPKTGYCWEDYKTAAHTIPWSIAKAPVDAPTLDKDELSLTDVTTPGTITVTRTGDGAVSAESSDEEVCIVSVNGTTVTVTAVADGEAEVLISVGAGTNHQASPAVVCPVTVELEPESEPE